MLGERPGSRFGWYPWRTSQCDLEASSPPGQQLLGLRLPGPPRLLSLFCIKWVCQRRPFLCVLALACWSQHCHVHGCMCVGMCVCVGMRVCRHTCVKGTHLPRPFLRQVQVLSWSPLQALFLGSSCPSPGCNSGSPDGPILR